MARIDDDPLAIAAEQAIEGPNRPKEIAIILGLAAAANIHPLAALLVAAAQGLNQLFSRSAQAERLGTFFGFLLQDLDRLKGRVDELQSKVQSPAFLDTLLVAADEAATTLNETKLRRFSSVLGYELVHGGPQPDWDEAASYLRDVGRLTEADIQALRVVQEHGTNAWIACARLGKEYLANLFVHCFRLTGFGLAVLEDVGRVTNNGSPIFYGEDSGKYDGIDWTSLPREQDFRLSPRGERLIAMLTAGEDPSE
jgi:hypothetical protein